MPKVIIIIPAGNGHSLFVKDFRVDENKRMFVDYRTSYNDVPFTQTEIFYADNNKNFVIGGDDGTVLWRFSTSWINALI